MNNTDRFEQIMAMVDAWADHHAGWDCRAEAEGEVRWCLGIDLPSWASVSEMTDQEIADYAIAAWMAAE